MEFKELLEKKNKAEKKYILLDGAMGTVLQASGLKLGQIPEVLSFTDEELLIGIHRQYVESGSDIIYTNTFGRNRIFLQKQHLSLKILYSRSLMPTTGSPTRIFFRLCFTSL